MRYFQRLTEADFELFRNGIEDGRLHPYGPMNGVMIIFPTISILTNFFSYPALKAGVWGNWAGLAYVQIFSTIIIFILSILFFFRFLCLKFQKVQLLTLIFAVIKLGFDFVVASLIALKGDFSFFQFQKVLGLYCIFSLLLFVLSLLRTMRLIKKGEFREKGKGFWRRQSKKNRSMTSNTFLIIFGIIGLAGFITSMIGNTGEDVVMFAILVILSEIIYLFGVMEFLFVLYCKFRFSSFTVTAEQADKDSEDGDRLYRQLMDWQKEDREEEKRKSRERREERRRKRLEKKESKL